MSSDEGVSNAYRSLMSSTSVIIPAYGRCSHLPEVISALDRGSRRPDEIIVSHSGEHDPTHELAQNFPNVRVLHSPDRLFAGAARNRGVENSVGDWLVFLDSDVAPAPDWLNRLIGAASEGDDRFVVGSVGVAEPGGYWGMSNWICEFSEMAPWRKSGPQTGGASCNMIVDRDAFVAAGGFDGAVRAAEDTLLFAALRANGLEHWFEPSAEAAHFNIAGFRRFVRHQRMMGFHSATVRKQAPLRGAMATRIKPLSFIIWAPRLRLILGRILAGPMGWKFASIGFLPGLLIGMAAWTAGFVAAVYSDSDPAGGRPLWSEGV